MAEIEVHPGCVRPINVLYYAHFLFGSVLFFTFITEAWAQPGPLFIPVQRKIIRGQGVPSQVAASADSSPSDENLGDNVFLPPDRRTLQRLYQAKELLAEGRYGEAVQNLGAILETPEDYFFQPQQDQPIHRSLKAEAQRLIGQMPRAGRELYELQYGARANQLLQEAAKSGDAQILAEVSRRFFHTRAGYEATFLLGLNHLDHGRPLAGALTLQRLCDSCDCYHEFEPALSLAMATGWLQAGMPDKARETLIAFRARNPRLALKVAAQEVPLFNDQKEALDWLKKLVGTQPASETAEADRWLMFRGNAQRNAITSGGAPLLNLCWRSPATDHPLIEDILEQSHRYSLERDIPALPSFHPLVVDDVVLMRTYKNLAAVDFTTGKRLWEVPGDDFLENLTAAGNFDTNPQLFFLAPLLNQRVWNDATFGTLSSDGKLVFCVEDSGPLLGLRPGSSARRVFNFNDPTATPAYNRLAAYDIHSGKLKWQASGDPDDFGVRIPDAFFLGPPLPLLGQLYVLAERKGEIRLLALDAANGSLLWSQQLVVVERSIQQDWLRRLTGISPSYADGILVCPTSAGALVAVDLATRSLLWGYRYGRDDSANVERLLLPPFGEVRPHQAQAVDPGVCLANGRIIVTPIDSDSLHCLNLIDGQLRWKRKSQDDLYVACAHQDTVILVGNHQVQAIRLDDGKPAWGGRVLTFPEDAMPSGRGFFTGQSYFLPLDSAQVAEIDLTEGKITHLFESRNGCVPGNLICYKGKMLSQSYDGLDAFYQLDSALSEAHRRLAADPADAEGLSLQGEIFLDAGKRAEALECFQKAYALHGEPRGRELLREALLDGLQQEFAVYRGRSAQIESLLDNPSQWATYHRLMAEGLRHSGDLLAAFEQCQKLIDLDADQLPLETVSNSLCVRRDRWIQAQLAALRMEAKAETAENIDDAIRKRLQPALASGTIASLKRFLAFFGNQPIAAQARAELMRQLQQSRRLLEAEMTLWQSFPGSDPAVNAPALAEVAELLRDAGRRDSALATYNWLKRKFAKEVCRDGKTAEQLIQALPADDPLRHSIDHKISWPIGKVEVASNLSRNKLMIPYGRPSLKLKGMPGPYFADLDLVFDYNRRTLSATDALGKDLWQIALTQEQLQRQPFLPYNPAFSPARALGHLLLVSIGGRLFAFDTLGADEKNPPKILWSEAMSETYSELVGIQPFFLQGPIRQIMQMRMLQNYNQNNDLELVTPRYICVQFSRSLVALDPLDGTKLWVRQDMPLDSALFGDEEYVFVLPPNQPEALVLRALDGELLGTRKIPCSAGSGERPAGQSDSYAPLSESCISTLGRKLLFWKLESRRRVLELFDPWTQKSVWPPRNFDAESQYCLVGSDAIAVLQPDGELLLLNLLDGRVIAQAKLQAEANLLELTVIEADDQYLILTHSAQQESNGAPPRPTQPLPGTGSKPVVNGRLYALARNDKLLWPAPLEIHDQQLLDNQPRGLPVLIFACFFQEYGRNNSGGIKLSILAVDKRSGRIVYDKNISHPVGVFNIVGNPENKTVDLVLQRRTITLTFTDKPLPPPGKEDEKIDSQQPRVNAYRALLKSLEKSMEQMFGLKGTDDFEEDAIPTEDEAPLH
jgi:outer membrane protein assembly factor BamB